jgi:hypothetical protein
MLFIPFWVAQRAITALTNRGSKFIERPQGIIQQQIV